MSPRRLGPHIWLVLAVALLGGAYLINQVGGGSDDSGDPPIATPTGNTTPPTAVATATRPAPTVPAAFRRTGNAAVDALIDAVEAKDAAKLASLVEYTPWPCTDRVGIGYAPRCTGGQVPGTRVDVMPYATCEGASALPNEVGPVLKALVTDQQPSLYAVTAYTTFDDPHLPTGSFAVVLQTYGGTPQPTGRILFANSDGKLLSFRTGCPATPRELLDSLAGTRIVVPPPAN